ncbi:tyrosine-type recombinase/integrase [Yersinia kristensenii]|uniref:tyrosine-type recombinase/integrase n=1 Tax=Yersinia kristensenii TaxID=28152 RepID=UPI0023EB81DC|nr:tyrosine-type recombinase/integrase [Yersinia kristensenii]
MALGTHSMRKTRGWVMYNSGINIETIAKVLNHSSPAITMRYIGLDQHTVDSTYTSLII